MDLHTLAALQHKYKPGNASTAQLVCTCTRSVALLIFDTLLLHKGTKDTLAAVLLSTRHGIANDAHQAQ